MNMTTTLFIISSIACTSISTAIGISLNLGGGVLIFGMIVPMIHL